MVDKNLSYRIRTVVGTDNPDYVGNLNVLLDQDYDTFEIMSLKIKSSDTYRLHNSNHGVITGRVIANNGFGIPNAKISLFIESDINDNEELRHLYPYTSTASKNDDKVRYNLLPDNKVGDCHQVVGTFPNKTYMLENDILLEIYDKYYKYTTRTNNSGDYMIIGVPTGEHKLHMDLDLSDCGILSQRPRDFVYKGYTIEQFENANKFKTGTDLDSLSQIFSQDLSVTVNPFWGNSDLGQTIGITRADINVSFKFEPTCVFIGSIVSDNASNGISKKCVPTNQMGAMDDLVTGEGRIEMIRKTPGGDTEEFQIKGTQLINGDGVWCYQIPMNLDYMRTDEYGNMVPTDDPEKGIATRTRVRFRVSMQDAELNTDNYFRAKVLVPNNPQNTVDGHEDYDYNFGSKTRDDSYRDLFWNNVYTVKSYIPRFSKSQRWKTERFTGIKHCNIAGNNNPIPYNNIRVKLPLMFTLICTLIKCYVFMVGIVNYFISRIANLCADIGKFIWTIDRHDSWNPFKWTWERPLLDRAKQYKFVVLKEGLCPDLDTWYFAPMKPWRKNYTTAGYDLMKQTLRFLQKDYDEDGENDTNSNTQPDSKSIDYQNGDWMKEDGTVSDEMERICLTKKTDYLIACIEMALAQEYKVINFDFYNDWVNGLIYIPRWMREVKKKRKYWIFGKKKTKVKGCMNDSSIFGRTRKYMQLCSLPYKETSNGKYVTINSIEKKNNNESQRYHKNSGKKSYVIFGKRGGIVHEETTMVSQNVYYLKPCEWDGSGKDCKKVNLFAVDIVLLGSLNNCDTYGIPQFFKYLSSSSYRMPTNLALTNMDTDGALYADDDNTKCIDTGYKENGVKEIQGDNLTLGNELKYYNGKNNDRKNSAGDNYETLDYENEGSDTIPVTEAAGVAWNYTGPGQGESSNKKRTLYFPGGHFLGISCVNSQTNKKSCVNLERVCEIGSSISQRHENVRKVTGNENGTGVEFKYAYNVPTGLIAEDEITDSDARAMFATLNQRRLIATHTNPDTGYKYYDFIYRRPKGFGGEMNSFVEAEKEYNTKVDVKEENLEKFNINLGKENPDFDPDEPNNTQRRTIEDLNLDYYLFRMGLEYDQVKDLAFQKRKFLLSDGTYYLPQYENSYYFYFGLKDGATALDEFNKEFYAACDSSSIVKRTADVSLSSTHDLCNATGEITITIDNLEPEYNITLSKNENGNWASVPNGSVNIDVNTYIFKDLEYGTYKVELVDSTGAYFSKTIEINASINADIKTHHFNAYQRYVKEWYNGGYFTISNIMIDGNSTEALDCMIKVGDNNYVPFTGELLSVFVDLSGTYEIMLKYKCKDSGEYHEASLGKYEIRDTRSVKMTLGDDNDVTIVGDGTEDIRNWWDTTWWRSFYTATNDSAKNWALKHYLFAQDDVKEGTESFGVTISSKGSRALFGEAQNKDNGFDGKIHVQNEILDSGYALSDRYGYWQTLDQNGENAKAYGTMAYNGTVIGGEYCGYVGNWIGSRKVFWTDDNGKKLTLSKAIGVLAKSRDSEDITYAKVVEDGKDISGNTTYSIEFINSSYSIDDDWVLFPLFRYPLIYRPFFSTLFFISHSSKVIELTANSDSSVAPSVEYKNDNSRLIGELFNGITYFNYDKGVDEWGDATICGTHLENALTGLTAADSFGIRAEVSGKTNIAQFANSKDEWVIGKRPQLIGLADSETGTPWIIEDNASDFSYEIYEGTPKGKESKAISITDSITATFFDNVVYASNGSVGKFYGIGDTDDDTNYYIISKNDIWGDNKIITGGDAIAKSKQLPLYFADDEGKTLYVLGKYNENAPLDQKGGIVFIKIEDNSGRFSKTTTDGKTIVRIDVDSVEDIIANPNLLISNSYNKFYESGVTLQISSSISYDKSSNNSWETLYNLVKPYEFDGFDDIIEHSGLTRSIKIDGKHVYAFNPEQDTVIGVRVKNTGEWGRLGRVMLYPYCEESATYQLDGTEPYIVVQPDALRFDQGGGEMKVTVMSNVKWAIDNNTIPSWLTIDTSYLSGESGTYTIILSAGRTTKDNEETKIRIYSVNDPDIDTFLVVSQLMDKPILDPVIGFGQDNIYTDFSGKTITNSVKIDNLTDVTVSIVNLTNPKDDRYQGNVKMDGNAIEVTLLDNPSALEYNYKIIVTGKAINGSDDNYSKSFNIIQNYYAILIEFANGEGEYFYMSEHGNVITSQSLGYSVYLAKYSNSDEDPIKYGEDKQYYSSGKWTYGKSDGTEMSVMIVVTDIKGDNMISIEKNRQFVFKQADYGDKLIKRIFISPLAEQN